MSLLLFVKGLLKISEAKADKLYSLHMSTNLMKPRSFKQDVDEEELRYFANYIGIDYKFLQNQLKKNKNKNLSMNDLKNYLRTKLSGKKFENIFKKYATFKEDDDDDEVFMGPEDLQKFFLEVQKEEISLLEACQIIIQFNNVNTIKTMVEAFHTNKFDIVNYTERLRLYIDLKEFSRMLHSSLFTVYNRTLFNKPLDLDRPLNEYFIKSTHNTYLTEHQLTGESSVKMYSTSLLYNFRVVELDCYNDVGDNIIITHGYSFVTDLNLDDILYELKDTAFVNSDLPVILSIENHLDKRHQEIFARKCQQILIFYFLN